MADNTASGGLGLPGILFLIFLVLKLTGQIDWSWWWVTSPLWIAAIISVSIYSLGAWLVVRHRRKYPIQTALDDYARSLRPK